MSLRRWAGMVGVMGTLMLPCMAAASEYHGQALLGTVPVSGATVTATRAGKTVATVTDTQGLFSFPDLADGAWTVDVEMTGLAGVKQDVTVGADAPAVKWELKVLTLEAMRAAIKLEKQQPAPVVAEAPGATLGKPEAKKADAVQVASAASADDASRSSDGLLVNGSVSNAATSAFSMPAAFGNTRSGGRNLYNGGFGLVVDSSAFDARPYSLSGLTIPKASYNRITGVFNFGGPIRIPHLLLHGPNFFIGYQLTRNQNASTESALVPDAAERTGNFANELNALGQPYQIYNPATGLPYSGNVVPLSPQALALLSFYPAPNLAGDSRYNYQTQINSTTHQDSLQVRLDKSVSPKNQINGGFAFQSGSTNGANLFGFVDTSDVLGLSANVNGSHRFNQRLFLNLGYRFSRLSTRVTPNFEGKTNVSGAAGITGNDQSPANWGPPSLTFSSGIVGLSDAQSSFNRNETNGLSASVTWNRAKHNIDAGGDFRRQEFNYFTQQNPRGSFTFTGAATQGQVNNVLLGGSDFADFLIGVPDTSAIAFGNPDKYLRQSAYDAYIRDDWRLRPELTLNVGVRWEYGAPITELYGRLVGLDVLGGFASVAPVVANNPVGPLTKMPYATSLVQPDKQGIEPRIGVSWRPISGSSVVVRAGYGVYDDTSVYQATALAMAQQAPLSKSLLVANSAACPLTLAVGFNNCATTTADTFAVDPNFRVGYAQTWQLAVQRDLPFALQMTATYNGVKGTRGVQQFLPNTYPSGGVNPCPSCPSGFTYRTSNGNSTREAGTMQLRRRLKSGFTSTLTYTWSKSIDDDSFLGGQGPVAAGAAGQVSAAGSIAQNWLNLRGERGLSTFDQRNLLNVQAQYTTGMGIGGGTLMRGWRGAAYKEWTVLMNITAGTGLPETPVYLAAVTGTGVTGSIRPNVTGASVYAAPAGLLLNPGAYTAPATGQWGNAGRDSITGPGQFSLSGSAARTIRLKGRYNLDLRIDATNVLNHVVYTSYYTTINSSQFGLPASANGMRTMQLTTRLRF